MLVMMERYQMRLEDLVEEKTSQLEMEKRKTVNLLHRMLPPYVKFLTFIHNMYLQIILVIVKRMDAFY